MYSNVKFPPPPVVDSNDDQSDVAALSLLPVLSSEFKQYRKHLNEMKFFTAMHPKYEQVNCWSIPPSSKSSNVVPDNPTIYIDTEDKFHQFSNMLDNLLVKEIAIDLEFDSNHLFHDCTALMQMSSINFNVIIDPFTVFNMIRDKIGKLMLNEKIVKLVFDNCDLRALQRDFCIFGVGVIDVQNICMQILNLSEKPSLKFCVKHFLNVDIDKSCQNSPWFLRPIVDKYASYAINDTILLLKLWNKLKLEYKIDMYSLNQSKQSTLISYQFPRSKSSVESDFSKMLNLLKIVNVQVLNDISKIFESRKDLFRELHDWRFSKARKLDCRLNSFLSLIELGKIFRFLPLNSIYLQKILRGHLVRSEFLEEIVVVIQKFLSREIAQILQIPIEKDESKSVKISQSCQGVIDINECWEVTEPAGPSESEIESLCSRVAVLGSLENNPEIGRATDESSLVVDKMEIEQIHDESSSLNVNSQSIDRPMTKKYKNFLSRTLKKQNFKRKNEERVKAGLPIMIKSRNAGLAHRKRTEARKLLKLPTGPLLPPGSYFRRGRVSGHGPL